MTATCDTGPLIALAKVNRLDLLPRLFGQVMIPPAVHRELLAKSGPEATRLDRALTDFLQVMETPHYPETIQLVTASLDSGESEAIALAYQHRTLLVMDERLGRSAARRVEIPVTGVAGVLIRAKKQSLEPSVRPVLDELRRQGYWLSDELLEIATRLAGED